MTYYHILTDVIIAGSFYLGIGAAVGAAYAWCINKKRLWPLPLFVFSIIFVSIIVHSVIFVPHNIDLTRASVDLPNYSATPMHIAVISDLHVGRFANSASLRDAVKVLREQEDIDALFIGGDLVYESDYHLQDLDVLSEVTSIVPTYAVLGNHDYTFQENGREKFIETPGLVEHLQDLNITVLQDTCVDIKLKDGVSGTLYGSKDLYYRDPDFSCIESVSEQEPLIILSHNPDIGVRVSETDEPRKPDLIISGHTHGGEIRLPGNLYLLPLPTSELPSTYDKGLFSYRNIPLFITSGIGNVATRLRTWNNPEVVILEIR
jgi:uncharacterized protein